ncbi:hypothetical protein V8V75_25455 [Peribacillus frigoritolerans]
MIEKNIWKTESLSPLTISKWIISDMEMISNGGFSPLIGFMAEKDYQSVLKYSASGKRITMDASGYSSCNKGRGESINVGDEVALYSDEGELCGVIQVEEMFEYDKLEEAKLDYKTMDDNHPGVKKLFEQGDIYIAGSIFLVNRPSHKPFEEFYMSPNETRKMFNALGWSTVVGF